MSGFIYEKGSGKVLIISMLNLYSYISTYSVLELRVGDKLKIMRKRFHPNIFNTFLNAQR